MVKVQILRINGMYREKRGIIQRLSKPCLLFLISSLNRVAGEYTHLGVYKSVIRIPTASAHFSLVQPYRLDLQLQ